MTLNELLEIVHRAYPDELTRECWNQETQRACGGAGDTLAEFIVREIADTYDAKATDRAQVADALLAMHRAQSELDAVAKALERRVNRYRREDAKAT